MLVLMDTALSFMNVNEPVYPLDIVKNMRDQRACMVQNVVSESSMIEATPPKTNGFSLLLCSSNTNLFASASSPHMRR